MIPFGNGNGHAMSPVVITTIMVVFAGLGLFWIVTAFSNATRIRRFRQSWHWGRGGRGAPVSRAGYLLGGISLVTFAVTATLSVRRQINQRLVFPLIATAVGIFALAGFIDAFLDWRKRGFPVKSICPKCGQQLDFKIGHQCPYRTAKQSDR